MVDTELLQVEMRSRGYTLERIALELGRSRTCIFNKIHNKSEFRASEVNKIARVLKLSKAQTNRIFFA